MEAMVDNNCKSIFLHEKEELTEVFTELWAKIINDKENLEKQSIILQTNI